MKCVSKLPYPQYICAMKEQMGSFTEFGMERFSGVVAVIAALVLAFFPSITQWGQERI